MGAFKSHPLFGVGYGDLWEYTDGALTAHNSVVVCAAELGLFGLYFWSLFLYPTLRDAVLVASPKKLTDQAPAIIEQPPLYPGPITSRQPLDKDEINRLGRLVMLSLTGFLVGGWFLSRAFVVTLFLLGGLAESIYQMALHRGIIAPRLPFFRALRYSGGLAIVLITAIYILVRILNASH
jgi:O-antigen ligase